MEGSRNMAMEGLLALVCAGSLLAADPTGVPAAAGPEDRDGTITTALAVQTAMQQGREYLLHDNPKGAVEVLERQLPRINGNPAYLALLRDAYRAYIKELRLANQEALARKYTQFLAILEPGTVPENAGWSPASAAPPKLAAAPGGKSPIIRLKREDEREDAFFRPAPAGAAKAKELVAQAEQAFGQSKYRDADQFFEQANQADRQALETSRDRWAYCKLREVVDQLNHQSTAFGDLEKQVRAALALNVTPRMEDYGKQLLGEIDKRRSKVPDPSTKSDEPAVTLRNLGRTANGWSVVESPNYRIYHNQASALVEKTAQVAERTRLDMFRKWFGGTPEPWNPKCDLYLHANAQDYSRATSAPSASPGHSTFQSDGNRVISRRIDLHCDNADMLLAVLPHEATHVVLAGNFGDRQVPRWADEGIAVLTEPRDKIERHLRNLPRHFHDQQLFPLRQLVQMDDYPQPHQVGAFYAQSVSLVEFLSQEKGPQVFTQFVRDGLRTGYDSALQRHYGYRSFEELEQRWSSQVLRNPTTQGLAQGGG
jgi:hypothetical protein